LSNNDVSTGSSPGQIILPIQFLAYFPPLITEKDDTATGGSRQLGRLVPTLFRDGTWEKSVIARVIYYEPALTNPRQNIDLRFTFRDQDILHRLSAGSYLVFEQDASGGLVVTLSSAGTFPKPWGWI
jgi:hypothetical protein